jgi:hypothetical protein
VPFFSLTSLNPNPNHNPNSHLIGGVFLDELTFSKKKNKAQHHRVFALSVTSELDIWPESEQRKRIWVELDNIGDTVSLKHESQQKAIE